MQRHQQKSRQTDQAPDGEPELLPDISEHRCHATGKAFDEITEGERTAVADLGEFDKPGGVAIGEHTIDEKRRDDPNDHGEHDTPDTDAGDGTAER